MEPDEKQYKVLENILFKINEKFISLSDEEIKRNNDLLKQITDIIIERMKDKDILFKTMYKEQYYGGSFYDGLKVGEPNEYDLDCLLHLPKIMEPTVKVSDKPGYVHVFLKEFKAMEKRDEAFKYVGLSKLIDDKFYFSTSKVLSWIESVINLAFKDFEKNENGQAQINIKFSDNTYPILVKIKKSGPALTLLAAGEVGGKKFNFDVDLVISFRFFAAQWPAGYRPNPYRKETNDPGRFLVVPKSPSNTEETYWRLSFQEQEKRLISCYSALKPTIRLIKKLRDQYNHKKIASYYIKTIFLWELETQDKAVWKKPLSYVFMMMLEKYQEYVNKGEILYYWNKKNNLIGDMKESTRLGMANLIKNMIQDIKTNINSDPYVVSKYLLPVTEIDALKSEVTLGKKHLKQLHTVPIFKPCPSCASRSTSPAPSSVSSSFEIIDNVNGPIEQLTTTSTMESLLLKVLEGQRKTEKMCEIILKNVDNLEKKVDKLERKFNEAQAQSSTGVRRSLLTDSLIDRFSENFQSLNLNMGRPAFERRDL